MEQAFLQVVSGVRSGQVVPLSTREELQIGRKQGHLVLDDPLVSGLHCRIVPRDRSWWLQDLGSTNGTLVDGRLVRDAVLKAGSEITIGASKFILYVGQPPGSDKDAPPRSSAQPEIAWLLDEELVEGTDTAADVMSQDLRLPPGLNVVVEAIAGVDAGKVYRVTKANVAIGRMTGEIPLTDAEVSRNHAIIEIFGRDMLFLRDLGSTNGTFHNARRVEVGKLQSGDTVGCGKSILRVTVSR